MNNIKLGILLLLFGFFLGCNSGGSSSGDGSSSAESQDKQETYSVTYEGNGNTSGSVPVDQNTYAADQVVTVLGNPYNLAKTGYAFVGWCTQADGNGTSYSQGQIFKMGNSHVILYAKWSAAQTYSITYDGNGNISGSVPIDTMNYEQGQSVTVSGNANNMVRTGYTFAGWCINPNGSGTSFTQGNIFAMGSSNITLYALWTLIPTYTVTYNGNGNTGGNVPIDLNNYQQGQSVTVLGNANNLVRAGYTFAGWCVNPDGNGTSYTQGNIFTMGSSTITLYALWTLIPTYIITYNGNGNTGGNVPVDSNNYQQGQSVTVLGNANNLVRTGSTFTGWNTQANGNGTTYTQGNAFTMGTSNVNLYAIWTALPTHTVTYNSNGNTGGSVPVDSTHYAPGASVTLLGNTNNLVRTGYAFAGWNTQADGHGTTYTQGNAFTMGTSNVNLYAIWTALPTHTVTYNGNSNTGGSVPVDSTHYTQGASVTVLGNTNNLVRTGYTFAGWKAQADGNGMTYTQGNTFTMGTADVILYADWTPVPLSLDNSFGVCGIVTTALQSLNGAESVALQGDGKIITASSAWISSSSYLSFNLIRYNSDGTIDTTFGNGGAVYTKIGSFDDQAHSIAIQADGKIVAAGSTQYQYYNFALARYNTDGSMDSTFGTGGKVTTSVGSQYDAAYSVVIQKDGKIVTAGRAYNGSNYDFCLVRYNTNGSLDTTFGGTGIVTTAVGSGNDEAHSVVIQSDGKIVAAGSMNNGSKIGYALVRYNTDGSLDSTFGGTGMVITDIGSSGAAQSIAIQLDGKIISAGNSYNGSIHDFCLIRYNTNGTLDTSFGGTGIVTNDVGTTSDGQAYSVAIQSDGKIVAAGTTTNYGSSYSDFALVRFNMDGTLDTAFGVAGWVGMDIGTGMNEAHAVAIQSDGRIVAAGWARDGSNTLYDKLAVIRYLP